MSIYKTLKSIIGGMGLYKYMPIFGSRILDYQSQASIDMIKEIVNYEFERLPYWVL